eukprot:SAG11_NODE_6351_length_1330_cov_3.295695_2_plen_33_part_01
MLWKHIGPELVLLQCVSQPVRIDLWSLSGGSLF